MNDEFFRMHFSPNKRTSQSGKRDSMMQTSRSESLTSYCAGPCFNFDLHKQLNGIPRVRDKRCAARLCLTHRVQQHSEKEFSPVDEFVQLVRTAGIVFIKDGVCEKAACLPGQHLWYEKKTVSLKNRKKQKSKKMHSQINARHPSSAENGAELSGLQAVTPHIVCFQ